MKGKSRVMRKLVILLLILGTISSCIIPANADGGFSTEGDQKYESGGGTSTATGNYSLTYTSDITNNIVGYRFTGIKANGQKVKTGTDVYLKNARFVLDQGSRANFEKRFEKTLTGSNAIYMYMTHYCKKEYSDAEAAGTSLGNITVTTKSDFVYEWDCTLTGDIPKTWDELKEWQKLGKNDEWLAKLVGYSSKSAMNPGDKIIVEPIFCIDEIEGDRVFMTASEIASYGQSRYGGTSNGWTNTGATGDGNGTFGFLSNYTNRKWPNSFYTADGMGLWEDASAIPSSGSNKRATFNDILRKGYGVCILYTDVQVLPDLYVESIKFYTADGQEQIPSALPLNKTIYVFATYKASVKDDVKANFFGYDMANDYTARLPDVPSMNVAKSGTCYPVSSGPYYMSKYQATMIKYSSSTASTRHEAGMYNNSSYEVCIGTLKSSDASKFGYYHAAIYLNDKTSATAKDETNVSNNRKYVRYAFMNSLTRDVETTKITLKVNGTEVTDLKSIPFGSKVDVYHTYRSNSRANGAINEPYCVFLTGNYSDNSKQTQVIIDGSMYHEVSSLTTTKKVASFYAISFNDVTRYGAVYLKGDYNFDADEETNKYNNKKSIVWAAKCDVAINKITLKDANGNVLGTYERGKTNTTPTLPANTTVYVYYTYKNNSGRAIVVNGHKSSSATSSNISGAKLTVPANGTYEDYGYSFNTGTSDGKVSGSVYVDKDSYDLSSTSATYTGCETNSSNNRLSMDYYVEDPIDLAITKIQYKYTKNGVSYTLTVDYKDRNTKVVEIPHGVKVYVWYTFKNNSEKAVKIDGYYAYNKTGNPGTLMSDTRTDYNANGITLNAGASKSVCSGSFTASTLGEAYYYGAVFQDGKTSATGEENTTNNTMTAKYKVRGYDVAITDIYFKDNDDNRYGKGTATAELEYGETYKIYYTIVNNSTEDVIVNIYDNVDPTAEGALCVTSPSEDEDIDGLYLTPGQTRNVYAGKLAPEDQVIGESDIDGSVFIGNNTSTSFTYGSYIGVEAITTNNTREETYTLKFDVAITDIYHTLSGETARLDDFVPAGIPVDIHYVVKNNSNAPVKVNLYYESEDYPDDLIKVSKNGRYVVIELGAGEEYDFVVNTARYDTDDDGYTFWGHVYRDGQMPQRDLYEKTFTNNVLEESVHVIEVPYLTAIEPYAKYRVGTDVITSFYLHNPTDVNYTGLNGNGLKVSFTVKDVRGNVLHTAVQDAVVVPANCEGTRFPTTYRRGQNGGAQLVFFKWSMPEEYEYSYVTVEAELYAPDLGIVTTSLSNRRSVCSNEKLNTPDTQYEAEPPTNWQSLVNANAPFNSASVTKSWYVYTYSRGRFVRNSYSYSLTAKDTWITPMSATTRYDGSQYYMRSGYGVRLYSIGYSLNGNATPEMYTDMQYAYATWQEFGYSTEEGCITTLEKVGSLWQLPKYLDYVDDYGNGKRIHFTPIWYPNRDYSAYVCYSDLWTPMGMITVAIETNEIIVDGDLYEDWYIGHG